jgi:hypothetical protein
VVKPRTNIGYMFGLRRRDIPAGPKPKSGKVAARKPRMAGDVLDLNLLQPGVAPEPYAPGADLRNELRAGIRDLDL